MFVDTHTHLYDSQFEEDRFQVIQNAIDAGVKKILLPNCNLETIAPMMAMVQRWPDTCFPMMGLHPSDVKEDFLLQLDQMRPLFEKEKFYGVGEIGLDYYWDLSFQQEQRSAFEMQINWALELDLPISIHTRKSIEDGIAIVSKKQNGHLKGVFHCFSGNLEQARQITDLGFYLGIGGVSTFKNGGLGEILKEIDLKYLILETDSPYLAPVPYRGKRNESAYIPIIAQKLADIKECSLQMVEQQTTKNALNLFRLTI